MDWNITMIEHLTEQGAKAMAEETLEIKDHTIYLIDFGGYFGYSRCVFKDGHHVHYANDYQLHHHASPYSENPEPTKAELRELYIKGANSILFTDEELGEPLKDYEEYDRKRYYLHNYYPMRTDYVSIFSTNEEKKDLSKMFYDPVGLCHVPDEAFVRKHEKLHESLDNAREQAEKSFEYMKSAFLHEMYNHEYGINWQADYDTLSAFGNITWNGHDDPNDYFEQLGFNDMQKIAYFEARREYFKHAKL